MCRGCCTDDVAIAHMPWRSGLEARVGGEVVGFLEYAVRGTWAVLAHTEAASDAIAHRLVRAGIDLLRARGHRILPVCPRAQAFLRDHPDEVEAIDDVPTRPVAPTPTRRDLGPRTRSHGAAVPAVGAGRRAG